MIIYFFDANFLPTIFCKLKMKILFYSLSLILAFSVNFIFADVKELAWRDLIPQNAKAPIIQLSPMHAFGDESAPAAKQLFLDAPVVTELNDTLIKLPGYIVPLDLDEEYRVNEFLLVPYFGACIHVPPPPPNQIIYVKAELGIKLSDMYDPFWVEGKIKVKTVTSELAQSAYSLEATKIYPYPLD